MGPAPIRTQQCKKHRQLLRNHIIHQRYQHMLSFAAITPLGYVHKLRVPVPIIATHFDQKTINELRLWMIELGVTTSLIFNQLR